MRRQDEGANDGEKDKRERSGKAMGEDRRDDDVQEPEHRKTRSLHRLKEDHFHLVLVVNAEKGEKGRGKEKVRAENEIREKGIKLMQRKAQRKELCAIDRCLSLDLITSNEEKTRFLTFSLSLLMIFFPGQ